MAGPLPQPNPNPAPAAPPINSVEAIRQAWHENNPDNLFAALSSISGNWNDRARNFLQVLKDENADFPRAAEVARQIESRIESETVRDSWRGVLAPGVLQLQSGASFGDQNLVELAATATPEIVTGSAWQATVDWLDTWLIYNLRRAAELGSLDVLHERGFFPPRVHDHAPIFHPLVLFGLRRLLKRAEFEPVALPMCAWLVDNLFKTVHPQATVKTVFAAGPVIFDLAQHHGVEIREGVASGHAEWAPLVQAIFPSVAENSTGSGDTAPAWQGKQAEVETLFETCSYWQQPNLLAALRLHSRDRLTEKINGLSTALQTAEASLNPEWFSPGFESAAQVPLPDRRGRKEFWLESELNNPEDEYTKLLCNLQERADTVDEGTTEIQRLASDLHRARAAYAVEFRSPLAKAALAEIGTASGNGRHPLTSVFLQTQLTRLKPSAVLYGAKGAALTQAGGWSSSVNARATTATSMLQTWGALEVWDSRRKSYQAGDADATALRNRLDWLKEGGTPPADADLDAIRPDLAALTHMVFFPSGQDDVQKWLSKLADDSALPAATRCMMAAARLDLGITRVSGGVAPAVAFPQILNPHDLPGLLEWIKLAAQSEVAWEARAGMNALIFLARLADTMDDLIIAAELGNLEQSHKTVTLVRQCIEQFLKNDNATPKGSSLPLAYVATDLTRYARTVARGIVGEGLITKPVWLPVQNGAGQVLETAGQLVEALYERFVNAPRASLKAFAAAGGLPGRLLLLAVFQIKLDQYARDRRLTVKAPRQQDVLPLSKLRRATREVLCGDAVLMEDWPTEGRPPWWQTRYWAGHRIAGEDVTRANDGVVDPDYAVNKGKLPAFQVVNWLHCAGTDPVRDILMTAAALEAAVPSMPPEVTQAGPGKAAVVFDSSFLVDIDGRLEGEFPTYAWKKSREELANAVTELKQAERDYRTALEKRLGRTEEMIEWLKKPLRLSTADFKEQIEAAIAEVRQAEADLAAAQHESVAAILEETASELIYEAAKIELDRQGVLEQISKKDKEIEDRQGEIAKLEEEAKAVGADTAAINRKIAGHKVEQARLELQKEEMARLQIVEEIKMIRQVLGGPEGAPVKTPTGLKVADLDAHKERLAQIVPLIKQANPLLTDDQIEKIKNPKGMIVEGDNLRANGQLAAMAVKVEVNLTKRLLEELTQAQAELDEARREERERKRKANRYGIVTSFCKFVGAAVGAFFGGPAGAALGAEIGAAVAELGIGIAENKPPEAILMGLVDNAFAIAGAAGYDLEKELNDLGAKGLAEVNALFESADKSLGPLLDSLPKVFDEPMLTEALQAFGLNEVPGMAVIARGVFPALKQDLGAFTERVENAGGLGTILASAGHFESGDQFRQVLSAKLGNDLFKETADKAKRLEALGRALGQDVEALGTAKGRDEALKRVSTLVVTHMSKEAASFRSKVVSQWLKKAQEEKKTWDQVQGEARALLDNFFPDPRAREQVTAQLRSALLDPETTRAALQGLLNGVADGQPFGQIKGGWMGELDLKMNEAMPKQTTASGTRVQVAETQVKDLTQALIGLNTQLLPFLKAEPGASKAREDLFNKLSSLETQLAQAELTVRVGQIEVDISEAGLEIAKLDSEKARLALEAARIQTQKSAAGIERASLMTVVAELSKLKQEELTKAQKASSEAARERAKAAQARVKAAEAALDARKAYLQAALRRGAEASRIRTALDRPPLALSLHFDRVVADDARRKHADQLERALRAYRELMRFYTSVGAQEVELTTRPDRLDNPEPNTWGDAFEKWLKDTGESFGKSALGTITSVIGQAIDYELTPKQIAALLSPEGFRLVVRTPDYELPDTSRELFKVPRGLLPVLTAGEVPEVWRKVFEQHGTKLTPDATFRADLRSIIEPALEPIAVKSFEYDQHGNPKFPPVHTWELRDNRQFKIQSDGTNWIVSVVYSGRGFLPDRVIEGLEESELPSGRIVGIFLTVPDPTNPNVLLKEDSYRINVRHLGDVSLSAKEIRLRIGRNMTSLPDRLFYIGDNDNPEAALLQRKALASAEGDPEQFTVQGLPISGTTILRLAAVGKREFERARLRVLYKHYTRN